VRSIKGVLTVLVSALALSLLAPGMSQAGSYDTTCSAAPDQGAGSTLRVANMSCRHGAKVTRKALKKFCKEHNDCVIDFESDLSQVYRGTVSRNGWTCKVADGWEYYRAKCRKGDMRAILRGGS